jgi:hypothetical protein
LSLRAPAYLIEINTDIQWGTNALLLPWRPMNERDMRYKLQSVDQLRACLGRVSGDIRVEVERGLAVTAESVADLRSLSDLPPGLILVIHDDPDPRFSMVRVERP